MPGSEPTTLIGRLLLTRTPERQALRDAILAIEAEARADERERLRGLAFWMDEYSTDDGERVMGLPSTALLDPEVADSSPDWWRWPSKSHLLIDPEETK
jgi:hypothetical protein